MSKEKHIATLQNQSAHAGIDIPAVPTDTYPGHQSIIRVGGKFTLTHLKRQQANQSANSR